MGLSILAGCSPIPTTPLTTPTNPPPADPTITPIPPTQTTVPEVTGDPEAGRLVFENGGANEASSNLGALCSGCHTLNGSDEKTQNGPDLQGISERAEEIVPGLSAAQYIHQSIMDPRAHIVDGYSYMSAAPSRVLTEHEINDLVAFLLTQ
jgi:mono/diheme cytochrome c family protein